MKHNALRLLSGLLLVLLAASSTVTAQQSTGLTVDAATELGAISPYVFGSNHGPWAAVPVDLLPAAKDSGITFLRFPGGNWDDLNDIAEWQLDFFMTLCKLMGAEASIHVRLKDGTPEKAAELVRLANIEKGYAVRYWAIGNEPNLFDDYDTELFNREWRAIAEAMLEEDPEIILLGPELSQYPPSFASTPKDARGRDWMTEFLQANGDLVDIVSVHRYPFPQHKDRATTIDELLASSAEWDTIIPNLRALILEVTGRELPIAVTEVNSHWNPAYGQDASPDSLANALWLADVLGRMIEQQVEIVNHFALQAPNSYGGWGLFGQIDAIRPSYYVYQLYKQFGDTLLEASSDEPGVNLYAARREDGALTLLIVNLSEDDKSLPVQVDHFSPGGDTEIWRLDASHNAELVSTAPLAQEITLPGRSVSLLVIPGLP